MRSFVPLAGLLVLLVVVAYLPAYGAGFVWDDDYYVIANRTLRDLEGLRSIWLDPFATPHKLGRSFAREGRLDEAIAHFEAAIRLSPGERQFHSSLGEAYLRRGDFVEAEAAFRRVLEPPFTHAGTQVKLARALIGQGRVDGARHALHEALRIEPGHAQATMLLRELQ